MRLSVEIKLAGVLLGWLVLAAATAAALQRSFGSLSFAILATAAAGLLPTLLVAAKIARPLARLLRAMERMVASYRDGDFNHSLTVDRTDELGSLLAAHNELATALREQHSQLIQRELLLDTITQNSPVALVLVDSYARIAYANTAAAHLLNEGRLLAGQNFDTVLQRAPEQLRHAIHAREDCLFSAELNCVQETFHVAKRTFQLQGRPHHLYLFKSLTRELAREELSTWKKLIRVLSHELNNSLAPVVSLAQSGLEITRRQQLADLSAVFAAIGDRTEHLHRFILRYAELAKLPAPRPQRVPWRELLDEIVLHQPCRIEGVMPSTPGWFDRAQIAQALINLIKNAKEAGGAPDAVEIEVASDEREHRIEVRDRGPGMSDTVMSQAVLPFYSTKPSGTGLGLALVREIAEAHGGRIRLSNRQGGGLCATLTLPIVSVDSAHSDLARLASA